MKELGYVLLVGCGIFALVIVLQLFIFLSSSSSDSKEKDIKDYQSFKKDTEIINGTVQKAEKENHIILPDSYNLVVKSKHDNKLVGVNKKEYRNYQSGSKVNFRIDKTEDNSIVRDLKNKEDVDTFKKYKKYKKDNPKGLEGYLNKIKLF